MKYLDLFGDIDEIPCIIFRRLLIFDSNVELEAPQSILYFD